MEFVRARFHLLAGEVNGETLDFNVVTETIRRNPRHNEEWHLKTLAEQAKKNYPDRKMRLDAWWNYSVAMDLDTLFKKPAVDAA